MQKWWRKAIIVPAVLGLLASAFVPLLSTNKPAYADFNSMRDALCSSNGKIEVGGIVQETVTLSGDLLSACRNGFTNYKVDAYCTINYKVNDSDGITQRKNDTKKQAACKSGQTDARNIYINGDDKNTIAINFGRVADSYCNQRSNLYPEGTKRDACKNMFLGAFNSEDRTAACTQVLTATECSRIGNDAAFPTTEVNNRIGATDSNKWREYSAALPVFKAYCGPDTTPISQLSPGNPCTTAVAQALSSCLYNVPEAFYGDPYNTHTQCLQDKMNASGVAHSGPSNDQVAAALQEMADTSAAIRDANAQQSACQAPNEWTWNDPANHALGGNCATPGGETDTVDDPCQGSSISWMLCPIINGMVAAVNLLMGLIDNGLQYGYLLQADDKGHTVQDFWQNMLTIANIAFVIVFLVIIFSTATSTGLNNYSIKKILPRLLIGAVLVNLSFWICAAAVDISNILGNGVKDLLMSQAIDQPSNVIQNTMNENGIANGIFGVTAVLLTGIILFATGTLGMVLLSVVLIFAMLAIRNVLVTVLIIISPIAFVLWLLPNTEKWFKKWLSEFARMLFVYPAIMAVWGACMLMINIISGTQAGLFEFIMACLLAIVPAVAILPIMKMGGQAMGQLQGLADKGLKRGAKELGDKTKLGQALQQRKVLRDQNRAAKFNAALGQGDTRFQRARRKVLTAAGGGAFNKDNAQTLMAIGSKASDDAFEKEAAEVGSVLSNVNIPIKDADGKVTGKRKLKNSEMRDIALGRDLDKVAKKLVEAGTFSSADAAKEFLGKQSSRYAALGAAQFSEGEIGTIREKMQFESDAMLRKQMAKAVGDKGLRIDYSGPAKAAAAAGELGLSDSNGHVEALSGGTGELHGLSQYGVDADTGRAMFGSESILTPGTNISSAAIQAAASTLERADVHSPEFVVSSAAEYETFLAAAQHGNETARDNLRKLIESTESNPQYAYTMTDSVDKQKVIDAIKSELGIVSTPQPTQSGGGTSGSGTPTTPPTAPQSPPSSVILPSSDEVLRVDRTRR